MLFGLFVCFVEQYEAICSNTNFIIRQINQTKNLCHGTDATNNNSVNDISEDNTSKIWLRNPYLGQQGEHLVKKLTKIQRSLTNPGKFIAIYETKKVSYFISKKHNPQTR